MTSSFSRVHKAYNIKWFHCQQQIMICNNIGEDDGDDIIPSSQENTSLTGEVLYNLFI